MTDKMLSDAELAEIGRHAASAKTAGYITITNGSLNKAYELADEERYKLLLHIEALSRAQVTSAEAMREAAAKLVDEKCFWHGADQLVEDIRNLPLT